MLAAHEVYLSPEQAAHVFFLASQLDAFHVASDSQALGGLLGNKASLRNR